MQISEHPISEPPRGPYHPLVKVRALKVLFEYKYQTGLGWTLILKEILRLTGAKSSRKLPLINRQDLENWTKGSVSTDDKFRWIYAFLTHPENIDRPEFSAAKTLSDPIIALISEGKVLLKFADTLSRHLPGLGGGHELSEDEREQIKAKATGLFIFDKFIFGIKRAYLALSELKGQKFLLAHILIAQNYDEPNHEDWNMEISSGYAIVGDIISIYVKGKFRSRDNAINLFACVSEASDGSIMLSGIFKDAFDIKLAQNSRVRSEAQERPMVINKLDTFRLRRFENEALSKIVDSALWRVEK